MSAQSTRENLPLAILALVEKGLEVSICQKWGQGESERIMNNIMAVHVIHGILKMPLRGRN